MLSKISKLLLFYIKFLVAFLNSLGFRNKLQNQFFAYSNVKKMKFEKKYLTRIGENVLVSELLDINEFSQLLKG